jgi:hypothetical protein
MFFYGLFDDRQSQAGSIRPGSEKWLKYLFSFTFVNSRPVVMNGNLNCVTVTGNFCLTGFDGD